MNKNIDNDAINIDIDMKEKEYVENTCKKIKLKQKIITAIFLIFIFYMGMNILYNEHISAENVDKSEENSPKSGYNKKLNSIYVDGLEKHDEFIRLWAWTNLAIGKQVFDDASYKYVIRDSMGKLHLQDKDLSLDTLKTYSDNLTELYKKEVAENIPFVYIQAPYKSIENYTVLPRGIQLYGNKKSDGFLELLAENKVPHEDIRDWVAKNIEDNIETNDSIETSNITEPNESSEESQINKARQDNHTNNLNDMSDLNKEKITINNEYKLDRSQMFYKTDHHWKTETAFWAYQKIFDYLKNHMNLIELDDYYRDRENYLAIDYPQSFLGSVGRRVGKDISGLDDYRYIKPNFTTNYEVYNMLHSEDEVFKSGDFSQAIEVSKLLTSEDYNTNRYSAYFQWDYGNLIINNRLVDNDYRVLIVKDSYSLPVAAFLSTAVSQLHMIDMREATDIDIADYSKKHDIDAVIVMYSSGAFKDEMFDFVK